MGITLAILLSIQPVPSCTTDYDCMDMIDLQVEQSLEGATFEYNEEELDWAQQESSDY